MPSSPPLASPDGADALALRRTRRVLETPQAAFVEIGQRRLLNFSSNDYLGLANHPRLREAGIRAIKKYGVGAGASPLVSGHSRLHEEAELAFAQFVDLPRALLFGRGYAANLGILTSLADRQAEIFADKLNHACLNDGALLSRARFTRYAHLDMEALEARLAASRADVRIVATDAVFSMDGDIAPVAKLVQLCDRHDAWLVLDDAHGIGVLGRNGRGSLEAIRSPRIIYMATLGKALGGYGAFVAGDSATIERLMQRARTYIYSTALPPMAAAAATAAIEMLASDAALVDRLRSRIIEFRNACVANGLHAPPSTTAIQPFVVGSAQRALDVASRLLDAGYFVPAIRPPTVPEGTSRLRVSLSAAHTRENVESLAMALGRALA